jgi:hypothetical protein
MKCLGAVDVTRHCPEGLRTFDNGLAGHSRQKNYLLKIRLRRRRLFDSFLEIDFLLLFQPGKIRLSVHEWTSRLEITHVHEDGRLTLVEHCSKHINSHIVVSIEPSRVSDVDLESRFVYFFRSTERTDLHVNVENVETSFCAGLPDFSGYNIPKPTKISQMATKCTKWPQNVPNGL